MARSVWKSLIKSLAGESKGLVNEVSKGMSSAITNVEKKVEVITKKALKAASVFLMVFLGVIFVLIGASQYLSAAYMLQEGIGYVIVGAALLILGIFAKLVRD